jgi:hypothetical protein
VTPEQSTANVTPDTRWTWAVVEDLCRALERAGYLPGDSQHVGRAILLLHEAGLIYAGERDHATDSMFSGSPKGHQTQ